MFDSARHGPEALLLLLAGILLFTGLGSHSIRNLDEATYAIVIDEMMEHGRVDSFTLRGEPYFNKAPLRIQASHLLAEVFGLSPWTLRIPSALSGLAAVAVVLVLGRRFYGVGASRWAALILITSTQFLYVHGARSGEMDAMLLAFWWAAILASVLTRDHPGALWWCAALVGLSALVKHLAYFVPVGASAVLWVIVGGDVRRIGVRRLIAAAGLAAAIALSWHVVQFARYGSQFVHGYFGQQVVERVADGYEAGYGWPFYLSVLKDGMFAWSLLLPFALIDAIGRARSDRPTRFLVLLATLMVGGLMVARGDLSWYLIPALPAFALLIGRWLATEAGRRRGLVWILVAVFLALSPSNVMEWDVHRRFAYEGMIRSDLLGLLQGHPTWWPQIIAAAILGLGASLWMTGRMRSGRRIALAGIAVFAILHAALPLRTAFSRSDIDLLSEDLASAAGIERGVVLVMPPPGNFDSVVYLHLQRAARDVETVPTLDRRDPDRWCVVRSAGPTIAPGGARRHGEWVALAPGDE